MFLYHAIIKDKPLSRWMKYFVVNPQPNRGPLKCSNTLLLGELTTSKCFMDIIYIVYNFKQSFHDILKREMLTSLWVKRSINITYHGCSISLFSTAFFLLTVCVTDTCYTKELQSYQWLFKIFIWTIAMQMCV